MYNNILFPIDLEHTQEAKKALKIAIEEAIRSKAKMTVMTVAPGFGLRSTGGAGRRAVNRLLHDAAWPDRTRNCRLSRRAGRSFAVNRCRPRHS